MLLSDVMLIALGAALAAAVQMRVFVSDLLPPHERSDWISRRVGMGLVAAFLALMAVRNPEFGVDTAAYTELFVDYCRGGDLTDAETSFLLSARLLLAAMFGQCEVGGLRGAWVGLIVVGLLCMSWPNEGGARWRYAALMLFSMVGVELATNALRQGFSVALMMLAVSHAPRRRVFALACALAAIVLHVSAGLVLLAFALAWLRWRYFIVAMGVGVLGTIHLINQGIEPALLQAFLFEIQKYLGHEDDELFIRGLAVAGVLAVFAATWMSAGTSTRRRALWSDEGFQRALRLTLTAAPFLVLPYFGYRYVYGIQPLVLFMTMHAGMRAGIAPGRHMAWMLALQLVVLLGWLLGSSVMMETPFLG